MLSLVPDAIEEYALAHTTHPGDLFAELASETQEKMNAPQMMSGPTVGWFLAAMISASGARRVLEVGTFTGYSGLMMASALPDDGQLITCDVDRKATALAQEYWDRSPHGRKIELKLGPAVETMDALEGPFDLVFIDADKPNYPNYYERALGLLSDRGVVVVDNVLWSGRVVDPKDESDRIMAAFNDMVQADDRVINVMLTVRDGLMLIRRK
ncbi:MAG: class I SAM-dependent methyltransferase [Dehalococcoidia bacterium]